MKPNYNKLCNQNIKTIVTNYSPIVKCNPKYPQLKKCQRLYKTIMLLYKIKYKMV